MKKLISILLVLTMLLGIVPAVAFAEEYSCSDYYECTEGGADIYEIIEDNCPIREEPHNKGKVVARAQSGQLISVKRVFRTYKMTTWCEIGLSNGSSLYIHIDNCKPHVHNYIPIAVTDSGSVDYCDGCGVARAEANNQVAVCDLTCIADQALKGSFSDYDPTFNSVLTQIVVAELIGPIADVRDIIGDILKGEPAKIIALDLVALLPLVGIFKYSDEITILGKNTDAIAKLSTPTVKLSKKIVSPVSKKSSTKLSANMLEAYELTGKDRYYNLIDFIFNENKTVAAHHIVAGGENNEFAKKSQALLAYARIDINDAENGVFLISKSKFADASAVHSGRHSIDYHKKVYERLREAVGNLISPDMFVPEEFDEIYRNAIVKELDKIAEDLMNGDLLLN